MISFASVRLNLFEAFANACERAAVRRKPEATHLTTGRRGERTAFFYLRREASLLLPRLALGNRARRSDLVAWEGDTICFIEVKTRTTRAVATAEASVDEQKRRTLRRLARHYLRQLQREDVPVRFVILSIYFQEGRSAEFDSFRGAFGWS